MTARDTRTGGKHEARERGAYETRRHSRDVDAIAWLERERKKHFGWYPFREFFEKQFQRQTA